MDQLTTKYQQTSQQHLDYINSEAQKLAKKCEEMKITAEQKIAALDSKSANFQDQSNQIKLSLKKELDTLVNSFESNMRTSFSKSLNSLESIYHQKELQRLAEIEKEFALN